MSEDNGGARRQQFLVLGVLLFFVLLLLGGGLYGYLTLKSSSAPKPVAGIQMRTAERAIGADNSLFTLYKDKMASMEGDIKALKEGPKKADDDSEVKKQLDETKAQMDALKKDIQTTIDGYETALQKQKDQIQALQNEAQTNQTLNGVGGANPASTNPRGAAGYGQLGTSQPLFTNGDRRGLAQNLVGPGQPASAAGSIGAEPQRPTMFQLVGLNNVPKKAILHDPKTYVPAMSYAPAKVIIGADATAGVADQADPRPMVVRITGKATSVIDKDKFIQSDLTGCSIGLEARADLSSERVYGRTLRMSCPAPNHMVREVKIKGFLADRGVAGVRAVVTERTGDLIQNAAIAGVLGGLGQSTQAAVGPGSNGFSVSGSNGISTSTKLREAGFGAVGGGISGAGDKLSDYYIKRLEQIQPVLSAVTGATLEVVFLEGFNIDGRPTGDDLAEPPPPSNTQPANKPPAGIPPAALQMLQQQGQRQ